jgi:hypothetical protein
MIALRTLILILVLALVGPAWAQPVVGSLQAGTLPTGRGDAVPLPAGRWRVTLVTDQRFTPASGAAIDFRVAALRNDEADPLIPYLLVRWSLRGGEWQDPCAVQWPRGAAVFGIDRHSSHPNQLTQRCSRSQALGLEAVPTADGMRGLEAAFSPDDLAGLRRETLLLHEVILTRWRGEYISVGAVIRLGAPGASATELMETLRLGRPHVWNWALQAWSRRYLDAMTEALAGGRAAPVAMLEAPSEDGLSDRIRKMAQERSGDTAAAAALLMAQSGGAAGPSAAPGAPTEGQAVSPGRLEAEQRERDRLAAAERERERLAAEQRERERVAAAERERLAAEARQRAEEAERQRRQAAEKEAQERRLAEQRRREEEALIGRRIALVIGNGRYERRPLPNPVNDADDMSAALKASGFRVIDVRDASLSEMRRAVREFGDQLLGHDVGLVFYAGHGVEVKGRNYFVPVNADIQREDEIADQSLDVSLILEKMSTAKKAVNLLIVDACRDDPFGRGLRSGTSGLASIEAPRGTLIAYATSPGRVAADGTGRNSPYTKHLLRAMQEPNRPVELVFKDVRRAVQAETQDRQIPWENTSLSGDFYFRVRR